MKNKSVTKGKISAIMGGKPTEEEYPSSRLMQDWNNYVEWLDKKKLRGHESLDKDDLWGKMIDQYRKENPSTTLSREKIIPIQEAFSEYREWSLNEIKNKRAELNEGVKIEDYMKNLSIVDGIAGQRTTMHSFPQKYQQWKDAQNKIVKTEHEGFSIPTKNETTPTDNPTPTENKELEKVSKEIEAPTEKK